MQKKISFKAINLISFHSLTELHLQQQVPELQRHGAEEEHSADAVVINNYENTTTTTTTNNNNNTFLQCACITIDKRPKPQWYSLYTVTPSTQKTATVGKEKQKNWGQLRQSKEWWTGKHLTGTSCQLREDQMAPWTKWVKAKSVDSGWKRRVMFRLSGVAVYRGGYMPDGKMGNLTAARYNWSHMFCQVGSRHPSWKKTLFCQDKDPPPQQNSLRHRKHNWSFVSFHIVEIQSTNVPPTQ